MARTRVYVAGAYSATSVIRVLENMRKGMRVGSQLLQLGFAPFVPWLDHHLQLMLHKGESLTVQDYYDYSMAWLEVSDLILVLPDWEESHGTKKEIERANELNIDVYFSLNALLMDVIEVMPELDQKRNIMRIDW
jgi:hypothetical protein